MDNPLIPTVKYATLITEGDGVKENWDFNFTGGYISQDHIKAFTENTVTGELVIRPVTFVATNTVRITPAVADGLRLIIYRDTPKTEPLVDYTTGSIINESNLDNSNKQAVFIAAELADRVISNYDFSNALLYAVTTATEAITIASGVDAKASQALLNSTAAVITSDAAQTAALNAVITADSALTEALVASDGVSTLGTALQAERVDRALAAYAEINRRYLGFLPVMRPTAAFVKAMLDGEVNITVVGDSISAGADTFYPNGWVQNYAEMLRAQIPWVKWNIINLSIGGASLYNLTDSGFVSPGNFSFFPNAGGLTTQWWPLGTHTSGWTWLQYVKETEPDMIILAHQENMGTSVPGMSNAFDALLAETSTWPVAPWYTLVSCFLPTKNPDIPGGYYLAQSGRQAIADWIRHKALAEGYGLIDVNALFRMLRDGIRAETVELVVEQAWAGYGDPLKWTVTGAAPEVSGANFTFTNSTIQRISHQRDFDITADHFTASGGISAFRYRLTDQANELSGYSVQFNPGTRLLQLFYGASVIASENAPGSGLSFNLRVKATGSHHMVFISGKKVIDVVHHAGSFAGTMVFGAATGLVVIVSPTLCLGVLKEQSPAYFTEEDLFGVYLGSPSDPANWRGGDGIHHLSSAGVYRTYLPAVQEHVREFVKLFSRACTVGNGYFTHAITGPVGAGTLDNVFNHNCEVVVPHATGAMAHITWGYSNTDTAAGQLQLFINGVASRIFWLNPTSGSTVSSLNVSVPLDLVAGRNSIALYWGATSVAMTSGGSPANGRSLAVTVVPTQ